MEIIHDKRQEEESERKAFSISFGLKSSDEVLKQPQKNLLDQMGSVFSVIHGGEFKSRRTHISA